MAYGYAEGNGEMAYAWTSGHLPTPDSKQADQADVATTPTTAASQLEKIDAAIGTDAPSDKDE